MIALWPLPHAREGSGSGPPAGGTDDDPDCITRQGFLRGLPVIGLRLICDQREDYANPIEPSAIGGEKIATAIARLVTGRNDMRRRSEVFA